MIHTDTPTIRRLAALAMVLIGTLFCPRQAAADTLTLQWDFNSEPWVTGYMVYVGTRSGLYSQAIDVQNTNLYAFTSAAPGQIYYFAVAAYTGNSISALSNEVSGISNAYPTLTSPGSQTGRVGEPASLSLVASDPEGQALTYLSTGLPQGLTISPTLGVISGTPTAAGTYSVTARVSDGVLSTQKTFSWSVNVAIPPAAAALHASTPSAFTGTTAVARPSSTRAEPAITRAIRSPEATTTQTDGSSSAAPAAYSGTTALVRSVASSSAVEKSTFNETSAAVRTDQTAVTGTMTTSSGSTTLAAVSTAAAPAIGIETPVGGATLTAGSPVIFMGTARDAEGGNLRARIEWSSNVDGPIGTGHLLNKALTAGDHTITASVTDHNGNTSSAQVTIRVAP